MGPNSAMWGREAEFVCGDEEKGEFCELFVDRSTIFIKMRSVEVGEMIHIVFYYYLRRAKQGGAGADIFLENLFAEGGPSES